MVWQWFGHPPEPEFQYQKSRLFLTASVPASDTLSIVNTVSSGGLSSLSFPLQLILYCSAPVSDLTASISRLFLFLPLTMFTALYSSLSLSFATGYLPLSLITADHTAVGSPA